MTQTCFFTKCNFHIYDNNPLSCISFTFQQHQVRNMQPLYGSWFGEGLLPPVARCVDPNAAQVFGVFGNISYVSHLLSLPSAPAFGTSFIAPSCGKRVRNMFRPGVCLYAFFHFDVSQSVAPILIYILFEQNTTEAEKGHCRV